MKALAKFIVQKRWLFFILFACLMVYCAFSVSKVNVEYSISAYLPPGTDTKIGIDIMADEFVTHGSTKIMIKDISPEAAEKLHDDISGIDGIREFSFDGGEACYKDGCALFVITFDGGSEDADATAAYNKILEKLDASGYSYGVPSPLSMSYAGTLASEMVIIIAIAAGVILIVLLFTSKSFAEIIAFPIVFIVAALLNMGTNYWLGTISFVSNTVCIILQLALAIDYAIILCHRFTEEKERAPGNAEEALITALSKAIPEIASSSLTTVSGLVALMFMQLTLGFDLGMVVAKSIFCSLFTVFFLMPGILLMLSKLMDKSRHRNFVPKLRFWGAGVIKARFVLIPAFVALVAVGVALSQQVTYCYSTGAIDTSRPTATTVAKRECDEVFGNDNMFAILVPRGDYAKEREVLDMVAADSMINSAIGLANIQYNGVYLTDRIDSSGFSKLTGVNPFLSAMVFLMYANANDGDDTPYLIDFLDWLIENKDSPSLSGSKAMIEQIEPILADAEAQLVGKNYTRLVFNIDGTTESPETFAFIERIRPAVKAMYPGAIFAGESMTSYDLNASFSYDNLLITMLTALFIFVILAITFRSPLIPIVLVLVIQGAIFINFSLPFIIGNNLFFFTYLIISAIQMGATIDYAILLTNRYRQLKEKYDKREAMIMAVSGAFPTVFTSGIIMCVAGFLVGGLTSEPLIASMGMCLGTGTIVSIIGVLAFLPALLYTLDPILEKSVFKPKKKVKNIHMPNPSGIPFN